VVGVEIEFVSKRIDRTTLSLGLWMIALSTAVARSLGTPPPPRETPKN
jgi:hypothetical protein